MNVMIVKKAQKKRRCKVRFDTFEYDNFSINAALFPYRLYYELLTTEKMIGSFIVIWKFRIHDIKLHPMECIAI